MNREMKDAFNLSNNHFQQRTDSFLFTIKYLKKSLILPYPIGFIHLSLGMWP